ncbi:acetylCoA C-acetyltransferase subfamily protein [Acanthamoeba castellanii str. Neff]|uniref:acetyl-CoA C-acyltransferase n=1 Tax=Acanthamoeba castellanii (strain ATCC 30010 / Neff) TaxID=1257118 RepID=L8GUV7_ACACF|nr:acetylCoA C-acetyltransferase subfamily protein [Acanthamoeba castellanii str. Neff]ELR16969.1 acetylCoA C-acetyltransferase subfamily protein [Acanthamoeba castellanii str. Neff]
MKFGLPMGVFRLGDLVGVDITNFINATYARAWPDRVYTSQLTALLVESKRLGQKSGRGWYAHSKGKAAEDPAGLQPILDQSRRSAGLAPREFSDEEIVEFVLFPVVNESCRVVEEGMVVRPSDVDIGSLFGYSFPRYRGGVLKWADTMPSGRIRDRLAAWDREFGLQTRSRFFAPSAYLHYRADKGLKLSVAAPESARGRGSPRDVVVVAAVRTPIGKAKRGLLRDIQADDLLAPALDTLHARLRRHSMRPEQVGDIVVGGIAATIGHLRAAAFLAGFPASVPVKKVDRLCSSGLQAVADAALGISGGLYHCAIAAGVESMSTGVRAPTVPNPKAEGNELLSSVYLSMGATSENVAERYGVTREQQDRIGYRAEGRWDAEIVPVATTVNDKNGQPRTAVLYKDEGVRADTTLEGLTKLKPAFSASGTSTAGNSSQVSDGASAVLLMTRALAEAHGWEVLGVFRSFVAVGCDPAVMGIGPALAIPRAVEKAGLSLADIGLFEINEAFASQFHYCVEELRIPLDRVNVNGGAIALGHPLGCTGTRLTTSLLHEMGRRGVRYGVVSMCVGTGMGAAAVFERC